MKHFGEFALKNFAANVVLDLFQRVAAAFILCFAMIAALTFLKEVFKKHLGEFAVSFLQQTWFWTCFNYFVLP